MDQFYREFDPSPDLRNWVDCLWVRKAAIAEGEDGNAHSHLVLPDGCIDVLFERAGSLAGGAYVVGMMTQPLRVRRMGKMNILAIRFRPAGAAAFFRESLVNLTDAKVPLADLWRGSRHIAERLADARTVRQSINVLTDELRSRLQPVSSSRLRACEAAIACMSAEPWTPVASICAKLGVSRQALAGSFRNYVGVSPKLLGRVLRLQHTLHLAALAKTNQSLSWARLSQDAGFYDQPHLVNEFKALTGMTPGSLLKERGASFPIFQD